MKQSACPALKDKSVEEVVKMKKEINNDGRWIIEFETNTERFFLYQMNEDVKEEHGSYNSYSDAQKAIDRAETIIKKKIDPLSFIKRIHYDGGEYKKGKITSIAEVNRYSVYVWTSVDKLRSKESSDLLKDTIENEDALKRISQLQEEIIKEERRLMRYTGVELKEHFGEN